MNRNEGSKKKFVRELIEFYKDFVKGSAKAVRTLADIQKKYEEEYETFVDLKEDPAQIEDLMKELSSEEKEVILLMLIKASSLGKRMNKLFDLPVEEKERLADDLDKFAEFAEKKLKELSRCQNDDNT